MTCVGCKPGTLGLGQTPGATGAATSSWLPWVIGGVAAAVVGGVAYYALQPHQMAYGSAENPTRKKTPGAYQSAIAATLMQRYGFSHEKAYAAVNDDQIGWKIAYLFSHNYNVSYATKRIHRAARRKFYGPWKTAGYMPLYRPLPPIGSSAPEYEQQTLPMVAEYGY